MLGRWLTIYVSVLHGRTRPPPTVPSLQPSTLPLHFHRPSSYAVLFSSHHMPMMPVPFQPPVLSLRFPPLFVFRLILSFVILSSFLTLHTHRSIRNSLFIFFPVRGDVQPATSATFDSFSCAFSNDHVSFPSAARTTAMYTFPLMFTFILLSHNTPDTLYPFFHALSTLGHFST